MTRYADPHRCPDCRKPIPRGAPSCPFCGLSLCGPLAGRLFYTLAQADDLLDALRHGDLLPAAGQASPPGATVGSSLPPPGQRPVDPAPFRDRSGVRALLPPTGLSSASVPKILLALGVLCLLVAALAFLAVSWSVMGVASRTATLLVLTGIAAGLSGWACANGLRAAGEALGVVALGLLVFDLFGAKSSGWLGDVGYADFLMLQGALLGIVAAGASLAARRTPVRALVGSQVLGVLGVGALAVGVAEGGWLPASPTSVAVVLITGSVTLMAHRARLLPLAVGTSVVTGVCWTAMFGQSFERAAANPDPSQLWLGLEGWPLLVSAALVGGIALISSLPTLVRVSATAIAGLVVAVASLIPFSQSGPTGATTAVLVVLVAACAVTWLLPAPWSFAAAVTLTLASGWMLLVTLVLGSTASFRLLDASAELWGGTVSDGSARPPTALQGSHHGCCP